MLLGSIRQLYIRTVIFMRFFFFFFFQGIGQLARISSHHVSKNIEFLTQDNRIISSKNIAQNINVANNRPLLIILTWMLSKRQHVMKFVNLYMEQGFDVAVVSLTPWQLMWPTKGSRVSIRDRLHCKPALDNLTICSAIPFYTL